METENVFYACVAEVMGRKTLTNAEQDEAFTARKHAVLITENIDIENLLKLDCPFGSTLHRAVWKCVIAKRLDESRVLH